MNKIVPGPYTDKLISSYLNVKRKKYSTNANSSLALLSKFIDEVPSGFSIQFQKQPNSQFCKVTLNRRSIDYSAESGYLPMAICLLFINSWAKALMFYNYEFLKMKHDRYLELQDRDYDYDLTQEEEILSIHPDIPTLFKRLSEDQIRALIDYANRK